ncbi:MAG: hypothetical protein HY762_00990 [Planctomycetes bacterium]|nr:hypothetical protein [Planctomycetota bacterium]
MTRTVKMGLAILVLGIMVIGYGGLCSKKEEATTGSSEAVGTVVIVSDPYISGATFFEDLNGNGVWDAGEEISTPSDSNGNTHFDHFVLNGTNLILKDKGTHNGVPYTGKIKRKVDGDGNLAATPLTTLLANGWTAAQIITVLSNAGLTDLTEADLKTDPMAGIELLDSSALTYTHLTKIQASLAVYSFMAIMDALITNGYDINYETFVSNTATAMPALTNMVTQIRTALSPEALDTLNTYMAASPYTLPAVTAGDVIRTAVAIANHIIPKVKDNPAYADPTKFVDWASNLGKGFYTLRNKDNANIKLAILLTLLPDVTGKTTFVIDPTTETVVSQ